MTKREFQEQIIQGAEHAHRILRQIGRGCWSSANQNCNYSDLPGRKQDTSKRICRILPNLATHKKGVSE